MAKKWVHEFIDARGKRRHVFRRKGHKRITLRGLPDSAEYDEHYHALVAKTGGTAEIGASRTQAGTFNALAVAYYKHAAFTDGLSEATQAMRRPIIDRFRETLAPSGQPFGEKHVATMRTKDVRKILEGRSRHSQNNWLKAFRGLMAFAISEEYREDDPSAGLKPVKGPKSMGHMAWKPEQVEQYRKRHPLGTTARLALELLLNIAARRFDAHEIGPANIIISNMDGKKKLQWRPHKTLRSTGKMLKVTIMPSLQAAIDTMPPQPIPLRASDSLPFLTNDYGRPFASAAAFGNKFADWCRETGLKSVLCDDGRTRNYRAHGLRKASLIGLAQAQCTLPELMAVSGHKSPDELLVYLEEIEQEIMAASAIDKALLAEDQNSNSKWLTALKSSG